MMTVQIDMIACLGNVIGSGALAVPSGAPDFAAMVSAASPTRASDVTMPLSDPPVAAGQQDLLTIAINDAPSQANVDAANFPMQSAIDRQAEALEIAPARVEHKTMAGKMPEPAITQASPMTKRTEARLAPQDDAVVGDDENAAGEPVSPVIAAPTLIEPIAQFAIAAEILPITEKPIASKARTAERVVEKTAPSTSDARVADAAPIIMETVKTARRLGCDKPDTPLPAVIDQRMPLSMPLPSPDKPAMASPDRMPTFAPMIADAVRDLVTLAQDKDVRFNVRPETLGPVSVTIERSDAGPSLRLGVETQTAVQAVRNAEPMLNDARGVASFVQVSVDLTSSDGRSRTARAGAAIKRGRHEIIENRIAGPVITGRYA